MRYLQPWTIVNGVLKLMRSRFFVTFLLAVAASTAEGQNGVNTMEQEKKPVVCKLTTPELQQRKATIIAELKALVLVKKELSNGYSYEFDGTGENLDKLNAFIKLERMCCNFFIFQLTVDDDKTSLVITGPKGVKEFLKDEIDF